jgi:hypothetical protein
MLKLLLIALLSAQTFAQEPERQLRSDVDSGKALSSACAIRVALRPAARTLSPCVLEGLSNIPYDDVIPYAYIA